MEAKREVNGELQEVRPLREPVREPEHCGRRMRKLSGVAQSSGALLTVYTCDTCGAQQRPPAAPATEA